MSKGFLDSDEIEDEPRKSAGGEIISIMSAEEDAKSPLDKNDHTGGPPETMAETVRRSGLAYSAGISLFASVVFMLVIGWGADLLFGSSPWGIVFGIVLGAVIGFVQFFRITSRIFKQEQRGPEPNPLFKDKGPEK